LFNENNDLAKKVEAEIVFFQQQMGKTGCFVEKLLPLLKLTIKTFNGNVLIILREIGDVTSSINFCF